MEATYKTANGRLVIKVTGDNQKALFRELASAQAVFDAFDRCGLCKSADIKFQVRGVDGNEYYELVCGACQAQFPFGQHKQGNTLFPKRDPGWHKWKRSQDQGEEPPEEPPY